MDTEKIIRKEISLKDLKSLKPGEWTEDHIIFLLNRSDLAVTRGVVAIYSNQEPDEISNASTKHKNGIGFNQVDAWFGTSIAKQILDGRRISATQIESSRKMLYKYKRRLCEIANSEKRQERQEGQEREELNDRGNTEQPRIEPRTEPRIEPGNGIGDPDSRTRKPRKLTVDEWIERDRRQWTRS